MYNASVVRCALSSIHGKHELRVLGNLVVFFITMGNIKREIMIKRINGNS